MLKRHWRNRYGLTPEAYRIKWGLPGDYLMVAPDYATKRSLLAEKFGLGTAPVLVRPGEPGRKRGHPRKIAAIQVPVRWSAKAFSAWPTPPRRARRLAGIG